MTLKWCHACQKDEEDEKNKRTLEQLELPFPEGYDQILCSHTPLERTGSFKATIKAKLKTKEEAKQWLEAFQESTQTTWRVTKTYPTEDEAARNLYRVDLRCQHNTTNSCRTKKNTFCPATMYLVVKRSELSRSRSSKNGHNQEGYFCHITLKHDHNHRLSCAEALRHRDVSKHTVEQLTKLFEEGHSPSSALNKIKHDLQEEQGENYTYASADRSICPDLQFCYRLYYKILQPLLGEGASRPQWEEDASSLLGEGAAPGGVAGDGAAPGGVAGDGARSRERVQALEDGLTEMFESLRQKLRADESFEPAIESLLSSYQKMRTDSAVVSACFTFGKEKGSSTAATSTTVKLQTNTKINVNPSAIERRKTPMGGRCILQAGRPPKKARLDPGYGKVRGSMLPNR